MNTSSVHPSGALLLEPTNLHLIIEIRRHNKESIPLHYGTPAAMEDPRGGLVGGVVVRVCSVFCWYSVEGLVVMLLLSLYKCTVGVHV